MTTIQFSQATGLSGDLKSELETTANDILWTYTTQLFQTLGGVICGRSTARDTSSEVHPLVKKLPGQQVIRNDDSLWQSFKRSLAGYLETGEQYDPIDAVGSTANVKFLFKVEKRGLSEDAQEKLKTEFASKVEEIKSKNCLDICRTFHAQEAELKERYKSVFNDGRQHPEFNYEVGQGMALYVNRPTEQDLDTVAHTFYDTADEIDSMPIPENRRYRLSHQNTTLARHALKYRDLNRDESKDWDPPSRPDTPL